MKRIFGLWAVLFACGTIALAEEAKKPEQTELAGKLGCGHCQYHKTISCAAVIKTADGKFYVIDNATKDVMDARLKNPEIKVAGKVTTSEEDGLLHVQATKQELTK